MCSSGLLQFYAGCFKNLCTIPMLRSEDVLPMFWSEDVLPMLWSEDVLPMIKYVMV